MRIEEPVYPVGVRITYFREKKGITVNKLATNAGLSQSHLRDIELGNKIPSVETLYYICEALGITLKDFFDDAAEETLSSDPVVRRIYRMNDSQREKLLAFLDTIQ